MRVVPREADQEVPAAASGSWRQWLMTGARREPTARRRVQGAHKELKRLLVEDMNGGGDRAHNWKSFWDAMARQAVEEAVGSLPPRQKQLIKLAYFSDLSNREIAQGLGSTLSSVERGLRQAVARVDEHVERGRVAGRRAIYALAMFLGGRWLTEAHQAIRPSAQEWVRAGALVVLGATAGAVLTSHSASPAQPYGVVQHSVVAIRQSNSAVVQHVVAKAPVAGEVQIDAPLSVPLPVVIVPLVPLPISVKLPPIPPVPIPKLPILHRLLGA